MDYVLTIEFAAWRTLLIIYGGFINTLRMVITNDALLSVLSIFIWKQISQLFYLCACLSQRDLIVFMHQ